MTDPYLAPSLAVLRAEVNARWPHRDHTSDGWIGDTRHQATKSDHNPNERGSVDAIDVDEDGVDFAEVFAAIRRHPSARYVIYERRLYHRLRGWRPEPYSGVNPHDHHFHVSIDQTREAEQDTRPWGLLEDTVITDISDAAAKKIARFMVNQQVGGPTSASVGQLLERIPAAFADDDPAVIAAAIVDQLPADLARQVADELAARLAS